MERFARWLWRRWRHQVYAALLLTGTAMVTIIVAIPALTVFVLSFDLTAQEAMTTYAIGIVGIPVVMIGSLILVQRGRIDPLRRWGRGDTSDPAGAWATSVELSRQSTVRQAIVMSPLILGLVAYLSFVVIDESWGGYIAVLIGVVGVVLASDAVVIVSFDLLMRPLREEIDEHLPGGGNTAAGFGVRSRIVAGMAVVGWGTGFFTATAALRFESNLGHFGAAAVASLAFSAAVVVGIARPTIIGPVFRPLEDLQRGIVRVRVGDYAQRLPRTSADEFGDLVASFNDMQSGLLERERLHAAFGSYVDPALAQRLLAQGDDLFAGEEVEVTVFFADVRDFTPYAEQATPREAVERLNALFELVVPVLREHRGHANKFLGDGVLAVFGVPEPTDHHADDAVAAACEIQRCVRSTFGESLRIGIGINTGRVIAGTIGGGGKLEFTLIGDAVNVAARVEQMTKDTGDGILLTQATLDAVTDAALPFEARGERVLKGKAAPTALYAVRV